MSMTEILILALLASGVVVLLVTLAALREYRLALACGCGTALHSRLQPPLCAVLPLPLSRSSRSELDPSARRRASPFSAFFADWAWSPMASGVPE